MKLRIKTKTESLHFESNKSVITIGRSRQNDFVVPLEDFSRKHCEITVKGKFVFLKDLGSKNGITIDGKKIPPHEPYPIYTKSKIILANYFELYLEDASTIVDDGKIRLDLNAIKEET